MVVSANVTSESEVLSAHVSKAAPEGASINRNFHSAVSTMNDENFGERGVSNDLIGRTIQGLKHRRSAIINQLFDTSAPEVPAYVPPQKVHPALAKLLEYDHVVTNAIKYHVASKQGDASAQHLAAVKRDELFFDLYSTRADLESMFRYMGEDGEIPSPIITGSRRYAIPIASTYTKQSRSLTIFHMYDRSSFDKQIMFSYDSGIDNAKCLCTIDNEI
ncbi:hypothetical protein PsorP6_014904 [Peronosclerospora sorghi]|uniref:Uncharacterized protein n=1 Tax=Peronosclerospora sorghi TaxID=230839 RepID=A0ACC0VUU5_9STRA|nr:hypothetical protein PsorP6_014904 [Peronosclerospora sorghi]